MFRGDALWANRNVDGTFRYEWDERNFPFDRHTLTIELEEGVEDIRGFVYEPDIANSGIDPDLQLPGGWKMTGWPGWRSAPRPTTPPSATPAWSRVVAASSAGWSSRSISCAAT